MRDPIALARFREQRFWYADGLSEIVVGLIVLLQNGFTLIMHFGNDASSWYWPIFLVYFLLFLMFAALAPRLVSAMRERVTYPRIGYAAPGGSRRLVVNAIVILTLLTIIGLLVAFRYDGWGADRRSHEFPVLLGLFFCSLSLYVAFQYGLRRYLVLAASSFLGLAVNLAYPTWWGREIWVLGVGFAFLCTGGFALWTFVRNTPLSADET